MLFALFILFSAFLIEGIGTYTSVVGLSSLFAANVVIILLAVALDIGKLASVSFLYKNWKKINFLMKSYMTVASLVLMLITSAGAFGFLSSEFQKAIAGTNTNSVVLASLTDEQSRLQSRKEEIDTQIAKLPDNMVAGRRALMKQFGPEVTRINDRLAAIDKELPALKIESIKKNVEVGPIIYVAEAFNTTPEHAVKWVILVIIFVFDPLAISLLLAGNYLLEERKKKKGEPIAQEKKVEVAPLPTVEPLKNNYVLPDYTASIPVKDAGFYIPPAPPITEDDYVSVPEPIVEKPVLPQVIEQKEFPDLPHWPPLSAEVAPVHIEEIDEQAPEIYLQALKPREIENEEPIIDDSIIDSGESDSDNLVREEPVAELPVAEEPAREVITIKQIIKPKPVRSSLEDLNVGRSDIESDENHTHPSLRTLKATYQDELPGKVKH